MNIIHTTVEYNNNNNNNNNKHRYIYIHRFCGLYDNKYCNN
jgi:hypothetical protein